MREDTSIGPQARLLPDNKRLHLHHGPIDLVIEAYGPADEIAAAYRQAVGAFEGVLEDLCGELSLLRQPCLSRTSTPKGIIARCMVRAARPHGSDCFVTPMIAVAGAVADHMLVALTAGRTLTRAYVNNGGDIALHLSAGQTFEVGLCANPQTGQQASTIKLRPADHIGGVATSGWRGRSHSLGIADAVTVLAGNAAQADVAATLIANAVDLPGSPKITRAPANTLSPDSDLDDRLVTMGVDHLLSVEVDQALEAGRNRAQQMIKHGLVDAVFLTLQGKHRTLDFHNQSPIRAVAEMEKTYA